MLLPRVQALLLHEFYDATIPLQILVLRQVKLLYSGLVFIPLGLGCLWVIGFGHDEYRGLTI